MDENCENCGMDHGSNEVPFAIAEAARIVVEKAMNDSLDPSNPLNQILVTGAGWILDNIKLGVLVEQTLDFDNLLGEGE